MKTRRPKQSYPGCRGNERKHEKNLTTVVVL